MSHAVSDFVSGKANGCAIGRMPLDPEIGVVGHMQLPARLKAGLCKDDADQLTTPCTDLPGIRQMKRDECIDMAGTSPMPLVMRSGSVDVMHVA